MTLIVGVKLPNGILLVSDTRATNPKDDSVLSDLTRKITHITPNAYLATAGTENTFLAARIIRATLYNADPSSYNLRDTILDLYRKINEIHIGINNSPAGPIMLAEFNKVHNTFNLSTVDPIDNNFTELNLYGETENVGAIGANRVIRAQMCTWVKQLLGMYGRNLEHPSVYEDIAKKIQKLFCNFNNPTISKSVYVTYLSAIDNMAASAQFFIDENGRLEVGIKENDTDVITFKEDNE
ncbi:hypothetical protein QNH36_03225 [Mesobacillus sp. AQ2]|uniref:hypothetical protein n=1 Tax=Mesobacillus sp. AQ2 TaxID=3043332 RepID=UPI0024C12641|nr:hypothetical protein [Mesobacillus sp. AQ2]WHX41192.1 hypothetical protein QNH36_03225 [Mesobacillus sp. AQ2]